MPKLDDSAFDDLHDMLHEESEVSDDKKISPWRPDFSPTQQKVFDSAKPFILAYGNRGGGKSYIFGHKLVRHCYENQNALAVIIVGVRSQATEGGIWDKLEIEILPLWKDNIGLEYTDVKLNEQRYRYRYIQNMHGGWSRIVLISMPWGVQVTGRIRGFEPSIVFVDELTTLEDPAYFNAVVQQIGRRPGISGAQQYMAACNPDGPRHWVYKRFFEIPFEEAKDIDGKVISKEGEWDDRYDVFHLQMEENKMHLNPSYYQSVLEATRSDPVEYKRMVEGEWVDRPTGEALFIDHYLPQIHVRGDKHSRIMPSVKFPVIIGYDLGAVNHGISFLQAIPVKDKGVVWVLFDEMVYTGRKIQLRVLVRELMRRMDFWNRQMNHTFKYIHVSDNSAFNQYNNATGSYEHLEVQRISSDVSKSFKNLDMIRMSAAPKFAGSREARVRLMISLLQEERFVVSFACTKHRQMFLNLQSEKAKKGAYDPGAGFRPKRSIHVHCFDSCTYPLLEADVGRIQVAPMSHKKTELIDIGLGIS